MKPNIFWLASYPKSGNTMLRLFLSLYFFTENGVLNNFNTIKNIPRFNTYEIFKYIKDFPSKDKFITNPEIISKYWLKAQNKLLNSYSNKIFFLKTHNAQIKFNNIFFTNNIFTKGFIYIVRDPRSILISSMTHYGHKTLLDAKNYLFSDHHISYAKDNTLPEMILSWKSHYLSWKKFSQENNNLGLLIKYEDMVNKPEKTFLKILTFISKKTDFNLNKKRFVNALNSIKFDNLQNLEKKINFDEKSLKAEKFFRKGKTNEWELFLPKNITLDIESNFQNEMKELSYIK